MLENSSYISVRKRLAVAAICIILPLVLLLFGIYGTFSFTFSLPLIWQVTILGEGADSLGLKKKSFFPSILAGIFTGLVIALSGGYFLKALGVTNYSMENVKELNGILQSYGINFSFKSEVGFRLLEAGKEVKWALGSFFYCVFLVGLGEEIFWRGFIQRKIKKILPMHASVWLVAILFGLVHFYLLLIVPFREGVLFMGLIALAGAAWGYLYEYFGNIWSCAFSHGVAAFIIWRYFVFTG